MGSKIISEPINLKSWRRHWIMTRWCCENYFCPNKQGITYVTFFSTIKDKLSKLGLEIKDTFLNIELKGCHFHLNWWIWIFVMDNDHRTWFSNSSEFTTFIKCAIGMAFSPLVWFQDGLDVMYDLGVNFHGILYFFSQIHILNQLG